MGCDIHLFVEKKVNGKWESADKWSKDEDGEERGMELRTVDYDDKFYRGRNYELFAILADVRNDSEIVPIKKPRGVPKNISPEVKDEINKWKGDGHSHSYFTIAELLKFDWTRTSTLSGCVSTLEFNKWDKWGRHNGEGPESYCGWTSAPMISMEEMEAKSKEMNEFLLNSPLSREEKREYVGKTMGNLYCKISWEIAYYKMCRDFFSNTLPRLLHIGKPSQVRIVFFFDN